MGDFEQVQVETKDLIQEDSLLSTKKTEKRITSKQLAKRTGYNHYTIHTWLCRSEFSKFYRRDRYFGKLCESFVYNREFKRTFRTFLKKKEDGIVRY